MDEYVIFLLLLISKEFLTNDVVRHDHWFKNIFNFDDTQFFEYFRMNKQQFYQISKTLYDNVTSYTNYEVFKEDMLIFMGFAAHESSFRVLRELFGIPKTTYFRRLNKFVDSIFVISSNFIKLPREEEFENLNQGFLHADKHNIILLIDGCHINISKDKDNQFYNRKQRFSINWLFVIDCRHRFRYASTAYGAAYDLRALRNSEELYDFIINLNDYNVLGDSAFRNVRNLIFVRPWVNTAEEREENNMHKQIRVSIENTFGMFKNKFRKFLNKFINGGTEQNMKKVVVAIVIWNLILENQ